MAEAVIFSVPIAGHTFQVLLSDKLEDKDGEMLWGQSDFSAYRIVIHTDTLKVPAIFYDTLFHELAHCFGYVFGIKIKERQAAGLGAGYQQALSAIHGLDYRTIPEHWKRMLTNDE